MCCKDKNKNEQDYLVCTCMGVMYSEICQAIEEGCDSFESLSQSLQVGTGCNSCVDEIQQIVSVKAKK